MISSVFDNSIELFADYKEKQREQQLFAIYRYQCMKSEMEKISKFFNEENRLFVPLKGAVIRELYPEPYLRISRDIDLPV